STRRAVFIVVLPLARCRRLLAAFSVRVRGGPLGMHESCRAPRRRSRLDSNGMRLAPERSLSLHTNLAGGDARWATEQALLHWPLPCRSLSAAPHWRNSPLSRARKARPRLPTLCGAPQTS